MSQTNNFMRRARSFIAFLIDATAAFFVYQTVALIVAYFFFMPFFPGFFAIWLLYYLCCFILKGTTLGLAFFDSCLEDKGKRPTYILRVIFREGLTSFPAVVLWLFLGDSIVLLRIALVAIACLVLTICRKRLFRLQVVQKVDSVSTRALLNDRLPGRFKILGIYGSLIILGLVSFGLNVWLTGDKIIMSEKPIAMRPRPSANSVKRYTDYINASGKDINEFIKELFHEYDHVVLCERWHPEGTQYDMIYDLVTTPYFADSVGHVFTEIGNVEKREDFRRLTATAFPSDSLREKAVASFIVDSQTVWLLWSNTNWFNFLKKMSEFNHDREKPVDLLFTDILWKDYSKISGRDSVMAYNIINTVRSDSIEKSLVIMNYRHAFMTAANCAYYLRKAFPGKVANVVLNTFRPNVFQIPSAIRQGKWDAAAEYAGKDRFAVDFKDSPFGDDHFDLFPIVSLYSPKTMKYKDMFNGMIYYTLPAQQYAGNGFPYLFTPENEAKLQAEKAVMPGDRLSNYKYLKYGISVQKGGNYFENYILNITYSLFILISIILLIGMWIATVRQSQKVCKQPA